MIEIRNCTKKYGNLTAVNNLSLSVKNSEIFGLLGPNGAGKSTTIKMLTGLIIPDAGEVIISGHDIIKNPYHAKRITAYIPEKSFIYEKLTAMEYLRFIGGIYDMEPSKFNENARKYLEIFGLAKWKDSLVGNFSHGMKQRLLLTSAFMRSPEVLILDEPHNGLDPRGIRLLKDIMVQAREEGTTIILCTHIIAIAEETCDRIAIINSGSIAAIGTKDEIKTLSMSEDRNLEDIFLGLTSAYEQ